MANKLSLKPDGAQGRFTTVPSLLIARQISSNDSASAASAASYRYETRVRELIADEGLAINRNQQWPFPC